MNASPTSIIPPLTPHQSTVPLLTRANYEAAIKIAMHDPRPDLVDAVISAHREALSEGLIDRVFGRFKKAQRKAAMAKSADAPK